tara:strand:- start:1323 stop:1484 length:162 start_codon:yes stop_codon:yes gene_type:complete
MIVHQLGCSFEVQISFWPRVKPTQRPLYLYLLNFLEVCVLGKIFSQQAVGVFI